MGLFKNLRQIVSVGQAANEAAVQRSGSPFPQRGFAAAFANIMADALGPRMAAIAERRGAPLPGSDPAVMNGTAWTAPLAAGAAAIQAKDAAFDVPQLNSFAGQVFAAIVAVWAGADAGSVRPVMSDALWEPLAAATGTNKGQHLLLPLDKQRATASVAGLHADGWYDSAFVVMQVHLDYGNEAPPADMPAEMMQWTEDWLFQRSKRPGGDPMTRPQACPSCGAPTHTDQQGLCLSCRVPVPFLTTGWLVSTIVSHHPAYAMMRQHFEQEMQSNPQFLQGIPPGMMHLLPIDLPQGGVSGQPPWPTQ
jgi:hypothetical protein